MSPRKVAMVAVDWCEDNEDKSHRAAYDQPGFFPLFPNIASACDEKGCDTILYALFSHSNLAQMWERGQKKPHTLVQRLARGNDGKGKGELMNDLPGRIFGSTMLLLCGEIGIINTRRDSDEIADTHHFLDVLAENDIKVILNPGHTFMRRREMPMKRAKLSRDKRWLLSVWQRGWHDSGPPRKSALAGVP